MSNDQLVSDQLASQSSSSTKKKKENRFDIVIIGSGPAGMTAAITSRKLYPNKSICVIRKEEKGVVPCAIPYMFSELKNPEDNMVNCGHAGELRITLIDKPVVEVILRKRTIIMGGEDSEDQEVCKYDRLIIATGSKPLVPPIPGIDSEGIHPIIKNYDEIIKIIKEAKDHKGQRVVIAGGSFIGVEFADELSRMKEEGIISEITVVELQPRILSTFDQEFSTIGEKELTKKGVKIITNNGIKEFQKGEDGRVKKVILNNGEEIGCDLVILGLGARPNTEVAKRSGIKLNKRGFIRVNKEMRTSDKRVYAVGDCAEKRCLITGKELPAMLASVATREARIAATNLYTRCPRKRAKDRGITATYSTKIGNKVLAGTGLTEERAKREKIKYRSIIVKSIDRHPDKMPGAQETLLKAIFNKRGEIIGAQLSGGDGVGEMINLLSFAIEKRATARELLLLQTATHPKLTSSPVMYPIIICAEEFLKKSP